MLGAVQRFKYDSQMVSCKAVRDGGETAAAQCEAENGVWQYAECELIATAKVEFVHARWEGHMLRMEQSRATLPLQLRPSPLLPNMLWQPATTQLQGGTSPVFFLFLTTRVRVDFWNSAAPRM